MDKELISRINQLMDSFSIPYSTFAMKCGIVPSNFKLMLEGKRRVTVTTLGKITAAYPQVSMKWLKTGEGEMIEAST